VKGTLASLTALLLTLAATPAWAQVPRYGVQTYQPYSHPVMSPYLNMARGGNAAINYFGLVVPQIQAQQAIQGLRQDVNYNTALEMQQLAAPGVVTSLTTGTPARFGSHWGYFQTINGRFGAGAGGYGIAAGGQQAVATLTPYQYGRK
jgi:hypothetical protein